MYKIILRRQAEPEAKTSFKMCLHFKRGFYDIGNFVPYIIKTLREDAHSRKAEVFVLMDLLLLFCLRWHEKSPETYLASELSCICIYFICFLPA